MTCIKKIQNTEVFGSKFSSRTLTSAGDISGYSFKAVVKNINQGKILEIPGIKNAGTINFDFSQLETLKKSTYQIEYWGDFGALGNEPFLLEKLSIVSAENATNCANSDNLNFEIKIEEISIPVNITKAINLNIENLTPEQIAQLKGPKGDKGDKGDAGEQGIQGIQGERGEKGDAGEKGDKGDKGDTGATGLQGIQGIQGVKGDKGEKGYKGDAFTYADFTPTQIAELQKPATDKVVELDALELSLNNSESLRVQNENTRISSENTRNTNEQSRVNAENSRVTAESSRVTAENARVTAELERQKNKPFNVKVTTPSSWVTGTLSETEIYRFSIPANTISSESILSIESMLFNKIGVNGFFQVRVKLTTSATLPTGSTEQIARSPNVPANIRATAIRKKFYVNGDVIKSQGFDSGLYFDEINNTDAISSRTLDRTQTYNVIISVTLLNVTDKVRLEGLDFNIK